MVYRYILANAEEKSLAWTVFIMDICKSDIPPLQTLMRNRCTPMQTNIALSLFFCCIKGGGILPYFGFSATQRAHICCRCYAMFCLPALSGPLCTTVGDRKEKGCLTPELLQHLQRYNVKLSSTAPDDVN